MLCICAAEVLQLYQLDGNGIRFSLAEAVIAFLQVSDSKSEAAYMHMALRLKGKYATAFGFIWPAICLS